MPRRRVFVSALDPKERRRRDEFALPFRTLIASQGAHYERPMIHLCKTRNGAVICQQRDASIEEMRAFRLSTALVREEI